MSRTLPLTRGKVAVVDDADYVSLSCFKWMALAAPRGRWYAVRYCRKVCRGPIYMHRVITEASPGEEVDHKNNDGLDCRRDNLRICTHSQNQANTRPSVIKASRFRGVYRFRSKWKAQIKVAGSGRFLGSFDSEEDAARAYDRAASAAFGEFATLNFRGRS